MSRWLTFHDVTPHSDTAKTRYVTVVSIHGAELGVIKWFGRWRQYAFFPHPQTIFNPECMTDICGEIQRLKDMRA